MAYRINVGGLMIHADTVDEIRAIHDLYVAANIDLKTASPPMTQATVAKKIGVTPTSVSAAFNNVRYKLQNLSDWERNIVKAAALHGSYAFLEKPTC